MNVKQKAGESEGDWELGTKILTKESDDTDFKHGFTGKQKKAKCLYF